MMTIQVPLRALLFVLYTIAVLAGSFGISYAVFEWRGDESDYLECVAVVQNKYLDLWESHDDDLPVSPDSPRAGASQASYDAYSQQWAKYEKDRDVWTDKQRELNQGWIDETRACN